VKERRNAPKKAKEKIQSVPKELLRRGLLGGTEKLRGQLRDAAEGGQREDTEADRAQDAVRTGIQKAAYQVKKLALGKKKTGSGGRSISLDVPGSPLDDTPVAAEAAAPDTPTPDASPGISQNSGAPARIKTRETARDPAPTERGVSADRRSQIKTRENVRGASSVEHTPGNATRLDLPQIKTRDPVRDPLPAERCLTDPVRAGAHQVKTKDARVHHQVARADIAIPIRAATSNEQSSQPMERGRLKFIREQERTSVALRTERWSGPRVDTPVGQQDDGTSGPGHTSTPAIVKDRRTSKVVRKTASDEKHRIKKVGSKSVGRTARQTAKVADSTRQAAQVGTRSAQSTQQAVRATV